MSARDGYGLSVVGLPSCQIVKSLLALALLAGVGAAAALGAASLPLKTVARTPLPGAANRFDYESVDAHAHRLYIAHMNDDTLLVVDTRTRRVVKKIHAPGVHGVIAVPSLGRVYASATNDHEALTIDSRTGAVLARAPAGDYPDGLAFDPVEQHVFVSDESGGVETVLNVSRPSSTRPGTGSRPSHSEEMQATSSTTRARRWCSRPCSPEMSSP